VGHPAYDGGLLSLYRWARNEEVLRPWLDEEWTRHFERIRESVYYFGVEQPAPIPPRPPDFAAWTEVQRDRWLRHDYRDGWEAGLIQREVDRRNDAAHPTIQAVYMPTWSATEIHGLASFVNSLWLPKPASG
jgi:hypothetical protein